MGTRPQGRQPGTAGRIRRRVLAVVAGASLTVAFPLLSTAAPAAPAISSPAAGATVAGADPTKVAIKGTAGSGTTVDVVDSVAGTLGTVATGNDGKWRLDVALADGSHTVTAIARDGGGVASPPSSAVTFVVDAHKPAIAVTSPAEAFVYQPGVRPRIQGSAIDDRKIHAIRLEYWHLNQLTLAALATCDGCGSSSSSTWAHRPSLATGGFYVVKAYAYDAAGNKSSAGQTSFATSGVNDAPVEPPTVPGAPELPVPSVLDPAPREQVPAATEPVHFGGRTRRGSIVHVEEEVRGLGTIAVVGDSDRNGRWNVDVRLPSGSYGVRVMAIDDDGRVSPLSKLIRFTVDAQVPLIDGLPEDTMTFLPTQPVVVEGTVLDDRRAAHVVLEYWLLDDLVVRDLASCPACPTREAVWQSRPNLPSPGYYYVKIRAFDGAGNQSSIATVTLVKTA